MQSSNIYKHSSLTSHKFSFDFINSPTLQKKALVVTRQSVLTQTSQKKHSAIQTLRLFLQELPQNKATLDNEVGIQAEKQTSLIEDPLWKQVCTDLVKMLGSFPTARIEDCKLEDLSGQDKVANICCSSEDTAQFLEEYVFVILESLRQYFPALKELRINNEGETAALCKFDQ